VFDHTASIAAGVQNLCLTVGENEVALLPECDFDQRFGYPCTEGQLARVKRAADENRELDRY